MTMMSRLAVALSLAGSLAGAAALPARAETPAPMNQATHAATPGTVSGTASGTDNASALARMQADMAITPSGDADVDFARAMIPHHRAAVDMARIVLDQGDDPDMRKLAQDVIAAQEAEIAVMQAWLDKNAPAPAGN